MRIPIGGGTPQTIFPLQPRQLGPLCSRSLIELVCNCRTDRRPQGGYSHGFRSSERVGPELARITLDYKPEDPGVILSPDGTHIAVLAAENRIKIFTIRGELIKEIQVKGPTSVFNFNWGQDSTALFVTGPVPGGHMLLRVSLDGQTQPVLEGHAPDFIAGMPSPTAATWW